MVIAKSFHRMNRMTGLSIIELLVAMGLSFLLVAGVITMFASSRSSYEANDRIARLQENGRFAIDSIIRDVRGAGYLGCSSQLPATKIINTLNKPAGMQALASYDNYAVIGYNYTSPTIWSPVLESTTAPAAANDNDVLLLRQPIRGLQPVALAADMSSLTDDLIIASVATGPGPFRNNQTLMIVDCGYRTTFEITDYNPATGVIKHDILATSAFSLGNVTNSLGNKYLSNSDPSNPNSAQLIGLQTVVYYVRDNGTSGNSLWRRINLGTPEELVEGVDSMQLRFGVDTSGDGVVDDYLDPNLVADPSTIIAVSIGLLLRSVDEYGAIAADTKTYALLGTNFTAPGDHRLRQTFITTATLRNFAK